MRIEYKFADGMDDVKGKLMIVESEVPGGERNLQQTINHLSECCAKYGCIVSGFNVNGDICTVSISRSKNNIILG